VITNATPSVTAVFAALPSGKRAFDVIPQGNGHVNVSPSAAYYSAGTVLTLTAIPEDGQAFLGWSGDGTGSAVSQSVSLNTNKIITASFTARPQLQISPLDGLTPDGFRASFAGQLGTAYNVLASTDLRTWDVIATMTNMLGTVQFNDPLATNSPVRFYRAVVGQ